MSKELNKNEEMEQKEVVEEGLENVTGGYIKPDVAVCAKCGKKYLRNIGKCPACYPGAIMY